MIKKRFQVHYLAPKPPGILLKEYQEENYKSQTTQSFSLITCLVILNILLSSADSFQNKLFKKIFQERFQSVQRLGFRSNPMLCQS